MDEKIIGIYTTDATSTEPPIVAPNIFGWAREQLTMEILRRGARVVIVFEPEKTYSGAGVFREVWEVLENGEYAKKSNVKVDILYDKKNFFADDLVKVNPRLIAEICSDKYKTYLFAPDMHMQSYFLADEASLAIFKLSHKNQKIVLKEPNGSSGTAVFVGKIEDYDNSLQFPLLAQEFLETVGGYKNLVKGRHDVRVGLFSGEPIYGLVRTAPEGGDKANLSFGGEIRAVLVQDLPAELVAKAKELDARFQTDAPRYFSADFGFNGTEWKLFEMNAYTGLVHKSVVGEAADEYLGLLADKLIENAWKK